MKIEVIKDSNNEDIVVKIFCKEVDDEVDTIITTLNNINTSIIGKLEGENCVIKIKDIYYFEAVENKVFAYLESQVYEVQYKIAELTEFLRTTSFIQTSRTVILNLDKIKKIKSMVNGRILAMLDNDEKMIITRVYANEFKNKIKGGK